MNKEEKDAAVKDFMGEVMQRLTGARVVMLNGDKTVTSVLSNGEVELSLKTVTLPRKLSKVANYIQGHITSYQEPGDNRLTVVVGIDKVDLNTNTVSFDIGFARDVPVVAPTPKVEAKETVLVAEAPAPEEFKVPNVTIKKK